MVNTILSVISIIIGIVAIVRDEKTRKRLAKDEYNYESHLTVEHHIPKNMQKKTK